MTPDLAHTLPHPGTVWGAAPMRAAAGTAPLRRRRDWATPQRTLRRIAAASSAHEETWAALGEPAQRDALRTLRAQLRRRGLVPDTIAQALGVASHVAAQTLGWTPRPNQRQAAAALLDGRMAEMATGEGKTLAIALAAAVAALAGVPVHVVTANGYLAQRDAARMRPLHDALGLAAVALDPREADDARRAAYGHDIVYATAKDLAFDFLRDRQAESASAGGGALDRSALALAGVAAPAPPLMRGLCMALLDEADSILLDEAEVPLILSRNVPHAARRAFLWQALAIARQLEAHTHFTLSADAGDDIGHVTLTARGEDHLATLAAPLDGPWLRARYRREAVAIALAALHVYRRNEHYVVRDGRIELLDAVTGRVAEGRVWGRGLHVVVALKESARPPPDTETVAQTTFQRFFQRYWRLCGISGTLREARAEMRDVYGLAVVQIPPHQPCRRIELAPRRFVDAAALHQAVAARVAQLRAAGRPVLVGTDSVADTLRLSAVLHARGLPHAVLNALNDAAEAAIVARAGAAGQVTIATRMAGRGTDIELDAAARAAGGLHVLSCQHNPSRRLDRQLAGRAARAGDPGSAEAWRLAMQSRPSGAGGHATPSTDDARTEAPETHATPALSGVGPDPCAPTLAPWIRQPVFAAMARLARLAHRLSQAREERRRAAVRRNLLREDLHWEQRLAFSGPAP